MSSLYTAFSSKNVFVEWLEAKRIALDHDRRVGINYSLVANLLTSALGKQTSRQSVQSWFKGVSSQRDPELWKTIVRELGLISPEIKAVTKKTHDFALQVLVKVDDPEIRKVAADIIREISENSY